MPRGHKSKHRAREKRRETHGQSQDLTGPQTTAEKQEEPRSSPSSYPVCQGARRKTSDSSVPQESQGASPTASPDAGVSCSKSDVAAKGQDEKSASVSCSKSDVAAKGQDEENASTSPDASVPQGSQGVSLTASLDAGVSCSKSDIAGLNQDEESAVTSQRAAFFKTTDRDPLNRKASALVQFLQEKFEKKEIILKADMLKRVSKKYKEHLPEILKKTSNHLAVVFGVELKEMDSSGESYTLVSKLGLSGEGILSGVNGLAKSGILVSLLSFIFMRGNRATEKEVWDFLGVLGIYDGIMHSVYGEPRKIIMEDLVQDKYLEYRQVYNSDPPCYEFLWGPRAHAETSKMRVLRALASINNTAPGSYPHLYEEALIDEVERALRLRY
uniref:MAGE domain-containing protein n=1 Tax=Saimiri boliviensis boliviensis TaxID=39432 RepID=A0A2K6TY36_SAIBB